MDDEKGPVVEVRVAVRPWGGSYWPGTVELSEAIPLRGEAASFDGAVKVLARINAMLEELRREAPRRQ